MPGDKTAPHQYSNMRELFDKNIAASALSQKQQAVLQASLELFAEKGFDATSTADIADLAGVSQGSVYHTFKTKQALLDAVLQPFLASVIPQATGEFLADIKAKQMLHFKDLLAYVVRDRLRYFLDNQKELRVFIQEAVKRPELLKTMTQELAKQIDMSYFKVFALYQAAGELVDWDAMRIVRNIFSVMLGYLLPTVIMKVPLKNFDGVVNEITTFVVAGLTPKNQSN